jgi:hypothetical protein
LQIQTDVFDVFLYQKDFLKYSIKNTFQTSLSTKQGMLLLFLFKGKVFVIYAIRFLSCIAAVCIGQRAAILVFLQG